MPKSKVKTLETAQATDTLSLTSKGQEYWDSLKTRPWPYEVPKYSLMWQHGPNKGFLCLTSEEQAQWNIMHDLEMTPDMPIRKMLSTVHDTIVNRRLKKHPQLGIFYEEQLQYLLLEGYVEVS